MAQARPTESAPARLLTPAARGETSLALATGLFLAACVVFSLLRAGPPAAVPASAPPTEFSAGRAMKHLEIIARKPHPTGSLAHAEVRDYLLRELSAAGLRPEVRRAVGVNREWGRTIQVGRVENVLARLGGTAGAGKALLLAAHYDSRPHSFGASDNGAAVAALLETLRALKAGPPLKNDLIFLFTDGEEDGLLGARAFTEEAARHGEVGLALNFEARGNSGPSIMFETSDGNGWLIREFARAAPSPVANSLASEIYKRLPNDTDLTVFKQAGWPGLNFAYIGGLPHYHTLLDRADRADQGSLQHHGSYALALARHFGDLDLGGRAEADAVYFDLLGAALVHYPGRWVWPLTFASAVFFVVLVAVGRGRRRLTLAGVALGFLALAASLLLSPAVAWLVWGRLRESHDEFAAAPGGMYSGSLLLLGFAFLAVALTSALYALCVKRFSVEGLTAGALLWWLILLAAVSIYLPGGSYLLAWPLLFSLAGFGCLLWQKGGRAAPPAVCLVLALCAVPGIILFVPLLQRTFSGLTLNGAWALVGAVVLLVGSLVPHLGVIAAPQRFLFPGVMAAAGVVLLAVGATASGFDARHPRRDSLFYGLDADGGKAFWASEEARPDEWTAQFFPDGARTVTLPELLSADTFKPFLRGEAPAVGLAAPAVALLEDRTEDGVRTLRLRVTSPRRAPVVSVYVDSRAEVLKALVDGKRVDEEADTPAAFARRARWSMRYYAFPEEGVELTCETRATEPLKLRVVDQSYELPDIPGQAPRARPEHIIPSTLSLTDSTFVSKSFVF